MLKVLAACTNGVGSSQIIKMKIEKVFKNLNIEIEAYHMSLGKAKAEANSYDIVFVPQSLKNNFKDVSRKTIIIGLDSLLSEEEIEEKVKKVLNSNN